MPKRDMTREEKEISQRQESKKRWQEKQVPRESDVKSKRWKEKDILAKKDVKDN